MAVTVDEILGGAGARKRGLRPTGVPAVDGSLAGAPEGVPGGGSGTPEAKMTGKRVESATVAPPVSAPPKPERSQKQLTADEANELLDEGNGPVQQTWATVAKPVVGNNQSSPSTLSTPSARSEGAGLEAAAEPTGLEDVSLEADGSAQSSPSAGGNQSTLSSPSTPTEDGGDEPKEGFYTRFFRENSTFKPKTKEDVEKERKRQKREAVFAAIGDGISALSNLWFTTQGAPSTYDGTKSMSEATRKRFDRLKKEYEDSRREYMTGYMRALKMDDDLARANRKEKLAKIESDRREERAKAKEERDKKLADLNEQLKKHQITKAEHQAKQEKVKAEYQERLIQSTIYRNEKTGTTGKGGGGGRKGGGRKGTGGGKSGKGNNNGPKVVVTETVDGKGRVVKTVTKTTKTGNGGNGGGRGKGY